MKRRLAAILAADVVGYSALMSADQQRTLANLRNLRKDLLDPSVLDNGGEIVKSMGDGWLIQFSSAVDAVTCGVRIQEQLRGLENLRLRIGVHLGDMVREEDDVFGDSVNIAARLEALAEPGAILISDAVYSSLDGTLRPYFAEGGTHELKNIDRPIKVWQSGEAIATHASPAEKPIWRLPKILLLPFRSRGSHDGLDLAESIPESVAEALSRFDSFDLIDPSAAQELSGKVGTSAAAKTLDARFLIDGSVQVSGGRARIRVQLSDRTGRRLWSDSFDRFTEDSFEIEDDIAARVATTVGEAVFAEIAKATADSPEADLNPYELMMRGVAYLHTMTPDNNATARDIIGRAMAIVPEQPWPKIAMAFTYVTEIGNGWPSSTKDPVAVGLDIVRDAMRNHDRMPTLHRLLTRLYMLGGEPEKSLGHSRRALELNPFDSDIVFYHGMSMTLTRKFDEAAALIERARAINPYAPAFYRCYLSMVYFFAHRFEDGLAAIHGIDANVGNARVGRIVNLVGLGRLAEAETEVSELLVHDPGHTIQRAISGFKSSANEEQAAIVSALKSAGLPAGSN